jgi:hypothetical protein
MAGTPESEPLSHIPFEVLIPIAVRMACEMWLNDKPEDVDWAEYIEKLGGCAREPGVSA